MSVLNALQYKVQLISFSSKTVHQAPASEREQRVSA